MKKHFPTYVLTQLDKSKTEKTRSNLQLNVWISNQRINELKITDCLPVDAAAVV